MSMISISYRFLNVLRNKNYKLKRRLIEMAKLKLYPHDARYMSSLRNKVAYQLRNGMKKRGISKNKLATSLGLTRRSLDNYLAIETSGNRKPVTMSLDTLERIASKEGLDCSLDYLLFMNPFEMNSYFNFVQFIERCGYDIDLSHEDEDGNLLCIIVNRETLEEVIVTEEMYYEILENIQAMFKYEMFKLFNKK